ncbi:MAG TPA: ABC transporter ATP-binding protein [Thermomicrobiales bacterium]|nr:ABC transporter ATP-binding protein [Thermomicrobiales bacterium]
MADIRVEGLLKTFGSLRAVDDITFSFPDSQVTCLLGPSGCGKTTLMRIIAGLEAPTAGEVYFGDRRMTDLPPRKREIGMVFQYPVVYKGISVRRNIELPLQSMKLTKSERSRRVDDVIDLLGLGPSADLDVSRLDNGTRQKVAVAREVARQPRIILFDEPITNVDATSKLQLKRAFKELTRRLRQTIVYVTHDQTEAMTLADQIALMRDGKIVQCDEPRVLYDHPADRFGGWFLGNPGMVFFETSATGRDGRAVLESPALTAPLALPAVEPGAPVAYGIRPEHVQIRTSAAPGFVAATLDRKSIQIGGQFLLQLAIPGLGEQSAKAKVAPERGGSLRAGEVVWAGLPLDRVTVFDADGARIDAVPAAPGQTVAARG